MWGSEKGKQAEGADKLVQKALLLIEYLAAQKAEQLATGVMMVVEGVEIDLTEGDGVVPGEPRGHVGHAPLHEAI